MSEAAEPAFYSMVAVALVAWGAWRTWHFFRALEQAPDLSTPDLRDRTTAAEQEGFPPALAKEVARAEDSAAAELARPILHHPPPPVPQPLPDEHTRTVVFPLDLDNTPVDPRPRGRRAVFRPRGHRGRFVAKSRPEDRDG